MTRLPAVVSVIAFAMAVCATPARADAPCEICMPAFQGDLATVETMAARGADINAAQEGKTPLDWALANHRWDVILWLLDRRARFAGTDAYHAYDAALGQSRPDVIAALIADRIDVNAVDAGSGYSVLIDASSNIRWNEGKAEQDQADTAVALLLAAGANANFSNSSGETPLAMAVAEEHSSGHKLGTMTLLLEAGARPSQATLVSAADIFVMQKDPEPLRLLLAFGARFGRPDRGAAESLALALAWADPMLVTAMIDAGVSVDVAAPLDENEKFDPAGIDGKSALVFAAKDGDFERVRLLLRLGANPDFGVPEPGAAVTPEANPLWLAFSRNDARMAALLLDYGAYPVLVTPGSPGAVAPQLSGADAPILRDLLTRSADANAARTAFLAKHPLPQTDTGNYRAPEGVTAADLALLMQSTSFLGGTAEQRQMDLFVSGGVKPLPDPPAEARRHANLGAAIAGQARQRHEVAAAALQFEAALRLAPWVGDWWRDACILETAAGMDGRAKASCLGAAWLHPEDAETKSRLTQLDAAPRPVAAGPP